MANQPIKVTSFYFGRFAPKRLASRGPKISPTFENVVLMNQLLAQGVPSHVSIPLTKGYSTIIDDADAGLVKSRKWFAVVVAGGKIVYAHSGRQKDGSRPVGLHAFLMRAPKGFVVDHINGDGLDNRRCNLRICTSTQNVRNQRAQTGRTSRFKGVFWHGRKWSVCIKHDGETIHLGSFYDERAAALQYDRAARVMFGKFARTNEMLGLIDRTAERRALPHGESAGRNNSVPARPDTHQIPYAVSLGCQMPDGIANTPHS